MPRLFLFLFLLLLPAGAFAQMNTDSLMRVAAQSEDSLQRLNLYLRIASAEKTKRPDLSIKYADSLHTMILALDSLRKLYLPFLIKGQAFKAKNDRVQAVHLLDQAVANAKKYGNHEGECLSHVALGGVYFQSGNYEKSLEHYNAFKAILGEPYTHPLRDAQVTTQVALGMLYKDQNQMAEAIRANEEGLELAIRYGFKSRVRDFYDNLGLVYGRMGNYKSKLEYQRKAIAIDWAEGTYSAPLVNNLANAFLLLNMIDSAAYYYQMAVNNPKTHWRSLIHSCNGLAQITFLRTHYEEALFWSKRADTLAVKTDNPMTITAARSQLAKAYMGLKHYDEAISVLEGLLVLMDQNPQFAFIEERAFVKKNLAQAVALKKGVPEIADWIQDFSKGKDSIHNFVVAQVVEDMRIRFETRQKEDSIQVLLLEHDLQKARATRYQISFAGGLALAAALAGLLFYFLRQRRLEREILQRQNEILLGENAALFGRINAMEQSAAPRTLRDFADDSIVLNGNEKTVFRLGDIYFIQSQGKGVQVVTPDGRHWRWQTMRNLEQALPSPPFIRVHRSYLINGMHIRKYSAEQLTLMNGDIIPVGGTQTKAVEEFLSQWLPDLA